MYLRTDGWTDAHFDVICDLLFLNRRKISHRQQLDKYHISLEAETALFYIGVYNSGRAESPKEGLLDLF